MIGKNREEGFVPTPTSQGCGSQILGTLRSAGESQECEHDGTFLKEEDNEGREHETVQQPMREDERPQDADEVT